MPPPVWTNEQIVTNFARWDQAWFVTNIGFTFAQTGAAAGFTPFTAGQMEATRLAFQLYGDIINLNFTETADDGNYINEIRFENHDHGDGVWGTGGGGFNSGVVNVDPDYSTGSYAPSTYNLTALLHEIGHALSLPHPGDYAAGSGEEISYEASAWYQQDSRQYTVMSYWSASETGADHNFNYGSTPLLHDVMALQAIYGANLTTRTGDTVYGFNSTAGRLPYDFSSNSSPVVAIWDAGGFDTIDLSGYDMSCVLNLTAGAFSNVGGLTGNLAVCYNAVIEAGIGGSAADTMTGNAFNNLLRGGGGGDILFGGAGHDTLNGETGNDQMYGGIGDDTYIVDSASDVVGENAASGTDTVETALTYSLGQFIENLTLTGASAVNGVGNILANTITGNSAANTLGGAAGADTLNGAAGNDILNGGAGADALFGGADADLLDGGTENDTLNGGDGVDTLYGRTQNDTLNGDGGNDTLTGGDGDDILSGGADDDLLDGLNHNDTLSGGAGVDTLYGRQQNDVLNGDAGADTLYGGDGDDAINGGADNDLLDGGNGADVMIGGAGADTLYGRNGADILDGGLGGDILIGGNDADGFLFSTALGGDNVDWIQFFNVAQDTILLDTTIFTAIGGNGPLNADAFYIGPAAADAEDRIIYHSASGSLYYDADGVGGAAATLFASLSAGLALTANNFFGATPIAPIGDDGGWAFANVGGLADDILGFG